jgi:hypothetical protein
MELTTTLAYLLEHQYTDASLSYDGLKGHNYEVAARLHEVCTNHGFCVYLDNLERSIEGGCDDDGYGTVWIITKILRNIIEFHHSVVDLDGTEDATKLNFEDELLFRKTLSRK